MGNGVLEYGVMEDGVWGTGVGSNGGWGTGVWSNGGWGTGIWSIRVKPLSNPLPAMLPGPARRLGFATSCA